MAHSAKDAEVRAADEFAIRSARNRAADLAFDNRKKGPDPDAALFMVLASSMDALLAENERLSEQNAGLRQVFEAARRKVGLREGCTYAAVVAALEEPA